MSNRAQRVANRKAASMLEFTLVAIPLIFILISIFEISRGVWVYNTLAHGVKQATRFAIVHGNNCAILPNNCTRTVGQICQVFRDTSPGLEPTRVQNITLSSVTRTLGPFSDLDQCIASTTVFPSKAPGDTDGVDVGGQQGQPVTISATYRFDSALAFYWTGSSGFTFGRIYLPARAQERVQY